MTLKNVLSTLEEISSTSSRNEKTDILIRSREQKYLRSVLFLSLNPMLKFNTSRVFYKGGSSNHDPSEIFDFLIRLSDKRGASDSDVERLSVLSSIDEETVEVVKRIINKDLRCGISTKTINKVFDNLIPVHNPMLCKLKHEVVDDEVYNETDLDKFIDNAGHWENICWGLKIDGVRNWAIPKSDGVEHLSRNGKPFPNFQLLDEEIIDLSRKLSKCFPSMKGPGMGIIDGEVYSIDKSFQKQMTQLRRLSEADPEIFRFRIFEAPFAGEMWKDRYLSIKWLIEQAGYERIEILEHNNGLKSKEGVNKLCKKVESEGWEGLVLRTWDYEYIFDRSYYWCKVKPFFVDDFPVVGFKYGNGKYAHLVGKLLVDVNGVIVGVSGMSDKEREDWLDESKRPKIIDVKYQGFTDDGSLRFPNFVRVREDK